MTYKPGPDPWDRRRPADGDWSALDDKPVEPIFPPTDDDEDDDPVPAVVYWAVILLCVFETAAVFYGLYGMAWMIGQLFK